MIASKLAPTKAAHSGANSEPVTASLLANREISRSKDCNGGGCEIFDLIFREQARSDKSSRSEADSAL